MASASEAHLQSDNEALRERVSALESELQQAQSERSDLEQIYQLAPVGLCLVNSDNRFVRINQRLAEINGGTVEQHMGASIREVIPEIADTVEDMHRRVFETGQPVPDVEVVGVTPAHPNVEKAYQVSYFPMKNRDGDVTGVSTVVQDVSVLKQSQKEFQQQSLLLEQIIDNVPHSIFWKDRNSVYLGCNARTASDLGLAHKRDIVGLKDEDTCATPQQAAEFVAADQRVMATGEPLLDIEESLRRSDGTVAVLLTSKMPVRDAAGRVTGVVGIYSDITERKASELALQESEQRLRTVVDHAPEAIVLLDADTGRFVDMNDNAVRLYGRDREAMLKVGPIELSPPRQPDGTPSAAFARARVAEALKGEVPTFEWTHLDAHGVEVPCEVRLVRLPKSGRNLIRGSVTDITERKKAQQALKEAHDDLERKVRERTAELAASEEKWRSLVTTAPDVILILEPDGKIRFINHVAQGYQLADVIGTSAYAYMDRDDQAAMKTALEAVVRTGELRRHEAPVDGPDGSREWYSWRMGPYREQDKIVGVTSIATNVTQRKADEQRLIAEEALLRKLLNVQELERKMLAGEIHDGFMQYVIGAHMHLESTCTGYEDRDEEAPQQLQLVNELLQKAISEGRRMISEVRPMIIDEDGIIPAVEYLIAAIPESSLMDVRFVHDVQFSRLESMLESAMFRIVQEALNNVQRHAGTDHAEVRMVQVGDRVRIEVRDEGVGFDPQKLSRDRFGIRIIRERARLFGGEATITSAPAEGTTIAVDLPLHLGSTEN